MSAEMTDIVERLRAWQGHKVPQEYLKEAADKIERLRERVASLQASSGYEASIAQLEIERLRAALQEIADLRYDNTSAATLAQRALEPKP